jgi:hypothetical protein
LSLIAANALLKRLLWHLCTRHDLPGGFKKVRVVHDQNQDRLNIKNPRAFCFVAGEKPFEIHATYRLENLPEKFILGVLYHELGHIVLNAFDSNADEPKVDAWCLEFAPELRYGYASVTYLGIKGRVLAQNLQNIALTSAVRENDQ